MFSAYTAAVVGNFTRIVVDMHKALADRTGVQLFLKAKDNERQSENKSRNGKQGCKKTGFQRKNIVIFQGDKKKHDLQISQKCVRKKNIEQMVIFCK